MVAVADGRVGAGGVCRWGRVLRSDNFDRHRYTILPRDALTLIDRSIWPPIVTGLLEARRKGSAMASRLVDTKGGASMPTFHERTGNAPCFSATPLPSTSSSMRASSTSIESARCIRFLARARSKI